MSLDENLVYRFSRILALKNVKHYIMKIKVMKLTFLDNAFYAPQEVFKDVKRC